MYRIFESVARLNDGIALCGRKERWRKLSVGTHESLRITELASPRIDLGATFASASFGEPSRITDHGCTLQCATFPGGSKVLLDSRGLLHLKSSDPTVAEVTLVLADSEVAGWTSDGYVCGPAFFFGRPYTSEPMHVFERMMRFLSRL
jgi:hypothetical protein